MPEIICGRIFGGDMSRDSMIRGLRIGARKLEARQRDLAKQIEAIRTTLRTFEQSDTDIAPDGGLGLEAPE